MTKIEELIEKNVPAQIPFYVHQSELAQEKQHTKHWRIACLVVFITMFTTLVLSNVAWILRENSFEEKEIITKTVTQDVDTGDGSGDTIVSGIGDAYGKSETDG